MACMHETTLDRKPVPVYHLDVLANLDKMHGECCMAMKTISSTDVQNNFGRILDDVVQNSARYVIQRRSQSQAIILSLAEFERILSSTHLERQGFRKVIRELTPVYNLGESVE